MANAFSPSLLEGVPPQPLSDSAKAKPTRGNLASMGHSLAFCPRSVLVDVYGDTGQQKGRNKSAHPPLRMLLGHADCQINTRAVSLFVRMHCFVSFDPLPYGYLGADMLNQRGAAFAGVALATLGVAIAGGAIVHGFNKLNGRVDKYVNQTLEVVDRRMGDVIRAVPGERWLQLVDDLNGPDEKKREAAQDYLKNVANIDPGSSYEMSVAFGFSNGTPLNGQIFAAGTSSPDEVRMYMEPHQGEALRPVQNTLAPAPTPKELKQKIVEAYNAVTAAQKRLEKIEAECPSGTCFSGFDITKDPRNQYEAAVSDLVDAQLRASNFGSDPGMTTSELMSVGWQPLKDQYAVVMLHADQLDAHKGDPCTQSRGGSLQGKGCIRIWVHPAGKPEEISYKGGSIEISIDDFYGHPPIPAGVEGYPIRFAAHRMDPGRMFDTNALRAYQDMTKLRAETAAAKAVRLD